MMSFPTTGKAWTDVKQALSDAKKGDYAWEDGRLPVYIYYLDEELHEVVTQAYQMYFTENALGRRAFPSLERLEREIVEMSLSLLGAGPGAGGSFTSGGTESIFLALKAARDRARAERPEIRQPNILLPYTAHATFNKAAHLLGIEARRIPSRPDHRADVAAMERAIDDNTILIVGSAPSYPNGLFDTIPELGQLALKRNVWLHVDACVGGFLAPFVRQLNYPIPPFDFSVPGVTSLSADLHKYGYAAKGASVVLYRDAKLKEYQRYEYVGWSRGIYSTETFPGSRPGGSVAAAWAAMTFLGEEGYRRAAGIIMDTKHKLIDGIRAIEGLRVLEPSELCIFLYDSSDPSVDISAVADEMGKKGWFVGRISDPKAIHVAVNPAISTGVDAYLADLRDVVAAVRSNRTVGKVDFRTY